MEAGTLSDVTFTQEQRRVFDWLASELGLPVFAEAYDVAWRLLNTTPPGYITLVSHIGRDFMNIFPKVTAGITHSQVQYHQHLDKIGAIWQDEWGYQGLTAQENVPVGSLIPDEVCRKVKNLLDIHKEVRDPNNQPDFLFFSTFLDYKDIERVPRNFLQEWKAAKDWFVGHAHLRRGCFSEDDGSELAKHFKTLDGLLDVAASGAYERLKGINEILDETNQ